MLRRRLRFNGVQEGHQHREKATVRSRTMLLDVPPKNILHDDSHIPRNKHTFASRVIRQDPKFQERIRHNRFSTGRTSLFTLPHGLHTHGHGEDERHESLFECHGHPPSGVGKSISVPKASHTLGSVVVPESPLPSGQRPEEGLRMR